MSDYRWYDGLVLAIAATFLLIWLFVAAAEILSRTIWKSRKLYTEIIEFICFRSGKPVDPALITRLETDLAMFDFKAATWRNTLLLKLQEASELADQVPAGSADQLSKLICERLGDLVRKTAELAPPDQRRLLVDLIKQQIAPFTQ